MKPEDLKVFDSVAYIDASINSLSLGDYSYIFTFTLHLFIWHLPWIRYCTSKISEMSIVFLFRVFQQFCVVKRTQSVFKWTLQHDIWCCWLPSSWGKMNWLQHTSCHRNNIQLVWTWMMSEEGSFIFTKLQYLMFGHC